MADEDDKPLDRRDFFGEAFRRVMRPVANYADKRFGPLLSQVESAATPRVRLRPPGALHEEEFVATCIHSGKCVEVCPVQAIRVWSDDGTPNARTPFIEASLQACVVCETIACTKSCPSGALQPLTSAQQIHMGFARMDYDLCVRANGEDCRICVEKCPVPNAIRVGEDGRIEVMEGCVGCGVCEMYCPTTPTKAITMQIV